jgi:hypothetical protein
MNWLEDERPQSDTPEYFEKQLDSLDLSVRRIRRQSEGDLRRSLIVANDAIENHESFGKITVLIPSKGKEWSTDYSPEFKVETGILPFLLERKKLVLKELQQYDRRGYEKTSVDDTEIDKTKIRDELTKMAERETKRWLWASIVLMLGLLTTVSILIRIYGWNEFEPWTYIAGIAIAIFGYVYSAIREREFSPPAIYRHALETRKKQLFQAFGVDEE